MIETNKLSKKWLEKIGPVLTTVSDIRLTSNRLSVDIGNHNIKILYGNEKEIKEFGLLKIPEACVDDNKLLNVDLVADIISDFLIARKINARNISYVIYGQDIVVRHLDIPVMNSKNIEESVKWEINKNLPENGKNYYLDYQILSKNDEKKKKTYKVLAVAAQNEKIDKYIELTEKLCMEIDTIDISGNSIARVFSQSGKAKKQDNGTGIIDIGNTSTRISIVERGNIFLEREVPFGTENLIREIVNLRSIDTHEASQYFENEFSLEYIGEDELNIRLKSLLNNVFSSFQKVIQFYATGRAQKTLDEIVIIGGGSSIKGLDGYLANFFNSEVMLADEYGRFIKKLEVPNDCEFKYYLTAYGMLQRRVALNLLPYTMKEKRKKQHQVRQYASRGVIVLCLLFLGVYFPMGTLASLRDNEVELKQQIDTQQSIIKENQQIRNQIDQYSQYIDKLTKLTSNKIYVVDKIRGIETYTPKDIVFVSLDYGLENISIKGTAVKYSSISEFAANLQMSKEYSKANISDINLDETNKVYNFSITIKQEVL